ncbi:MAG: hypothetical protein ACRBI6_22230, partial [Acidimicrobiales bacterium]
AEQFAADLTDPADTIDAPTTVSGDDDWVSVDDLFKELEAAGLGTSGTHDADAEPLSNNARPTDANHVNATPINASPNGEHAMAQTTADAATAGAAARFRRRADRMLRRRRSDDPAPSGRERNGIEPSAPSLSAAGNTADLAPAPTRPAIDPAWGRVVSGLLRSEFEFQRHPDRAQLETVFVDGTPLFGELREHNLRLRTTGLWVRGADPKLEKLTVANEGSPTTVAVTVLHPTRQLLDRDGRELGTRPAERREGLLWLVQDPSGRHRIAEAVDLGVVTPSQPFEPDDRVDDTVGVRADQTAGR